LGKKRAYAVQLKTTDTISTFS